MILWRRPIVTLLVAIVTIEVLMIVTGMGPDLVLVTALLATIGIGAWVLATTADAVPPPAPSVAAPRSAPPQRNERRVKQVRTSLAYGRNDGLARERLHTGLVAIVDDQLRSAHEIDRATDPAAARVVLGPDLTAFVEATEPPDTLSRPRQLDHILTEIEQL